MLTLRAAGPVPVDDRATKTGTRAELLTRLLEMITLSLAGGQERCEDEYRFLLASADLRIDWSISTRPAVSVPEATRV